MICPLTTNDIMSRHFKVSVPECILKTALYIIQGPGDKEAAIDTIKQFLVAHEDFHRKVSYIMLMAKCGIVTEQKMCKISISIIKTICGNRSSF